MTTAATQSPLVWLSAGVAGFAAAATLTTWLVPVLRRNGAVTAPGPDGNGRMVPRGGGLAIVAVTFIAALVAAWLDPAMQQAIAAWLVPAVVIAAVSLRDDFRPLPAVVRLAVHVAASVAFVAVVGPITEVAVPGFGEVRLGAAARPLTVLWIVGLTNAFNFMDGIDGIAGLNAVAAGVTLAVAAGLAGGNSVAIAGLAISCGGLGFLTSNWPPAKVFMGDVGSTFCGFSLAGLPLVLPAPARHAVLPVVALAMWPFIFDSGLTLLRRVVRRENVFEQHRGHLYQRLVIAGWSHRAVAGLYGLLAAVGGAVAVAPLVDPTLRAAAGNAAAAFLVVAPVLLVTLVQTAEAGALWRPSA
jgi:UDP-N-acetylmuramyl pentapeptide phosphotransferase/UDP-N-acetylglucosamine-1-phosphate transferase